MHHVFTFSPGCCISVLLCEFNWEALNVLYVHVLLVICLRSQYNIRILRSMSRQEEAQLPRPGIVKKVGPLNFALLRA